MIDSRNGEVDRSSAISNGRGRFDQINLAKLIGGEENNLVRFIGKSGDSLILIIYNII